MPVPSINHVPLTIKTELRFLGVVLDQRLKFDGHLKFICNKVSKSIGIVARLKNYAPKSCLYSVYYSLIYSYITYCNLVWGGTYGVHLQPLAVLQKRVLRLIHNAHYRDHTNNLFFVSKILKLHDVHKFLLGAYMYKNKNLNILMRGHSHDTRRRNDLCPMFHRLSVTQHSVMYAGPKAWNEIPGNIRLCKSTKMFKKKFRQHIIAGYGVSSD